MTKLQAINQVAYATNADDAMKVSVIKEILGSSARQASALARPYRQMGLPKRISKKHAEAIDQSLVRGY